MKKNKTTKNQRVTFKNITVFKLCLAETNVSSLFFPPMMNAPSKTVS